MYFVIFLTVRQLFRKIHGNKNQRNVEKKIRGAIMRSTFGLFSVFAIHKAEEIS